MVAGDPELRRKSLLEIRSLIFFLFSPTAVFVDNVTLQIDGVLYLRIMDPYKVSATCFIQLLSCFSH